MIKVIKYWEGLCKSARPANKSYQTLVTHYKDRLIPMKLQFFAFLASILMPYLTLFQTTNPMVPFMLDDLEKIVNQLLRLVFKRKALETADTTLKRMKEKWLTDNSNHLENGLVDVGAATKDLIQNARVSAENVRKFKGQCKQLVLDVLLKIREKSLLRFSIIRNASSLAPINMIRQPEQCTIRFRALVDKLYSLKRITSNNADSAKNQYGNLLDLIKYEHKEDIQIGR